MKILALEFSSAHRSVAAVELESYPGQQPLRRLAELPPPVRLAEVVESGRANTMQPFRMIQEALAQTGLDRAHIECIAVGLGPGSYTGIRAAIAIAQGWQLATGLKLVGVGSAAAIAARAWESGLRGTCAVIVDAQRGEFYLASYELDEAGAKETELLRLATFDEVRRLASPGCVVVGPDAHKWFAQARPINPSAAWIARLAAAHTEFVPGERLEPIYLREAKFVKASPPRIHPGMD